MEETKTRTGLKQLEKDLGSVKWQEATCCCFIPASGKAVCTTLRFHFWNFLELFSLHMLSMAVESVTGELVDG